MLNPRVRFIGQPAYTGYAEQNACEKQYVREYERVLAILESLE